jgi:hypothetical protein
LEIIEILLAGWLHMENFQECIAAYSSPKIKESHPWNRQRKCRPLNSTYHKTINP